MCAAKKTNTIILKGVKYSLFQDPRSGNFRLRKRTKDIKVDISLGVSTLDAARLAAESKILRGEEKQERRRSGRLTLAEFVDIYKAMPKRAAEYTAAINVMRLGKIVRVAWGKELHEVPMSQLTSRLWEDYAAKRQGGTLDLSTRRPINRGINAAIRMAVSIFHRALQIGYARAGIDLDFNEIRSVRWLPETKQRLPSIDEDSLASMYKALPALRITEPLQWRTIMIARYAGLRAGEIKGARKSWLVARPGDGLVFEVRDRPEDGYLHKTGEDYTAPIISKELIEDLRQCPDGLLVPIEGSDKHFFRKCNLWLRKYIQKPNKGLHRLRALYAEQIKDQAAYAARIENEAIDQARAALGHTTSKTTRDHYLPPKQG